MGKKIAAKHHMVIVVVTDLRPDEDILGRGLEAKVKFIDDETGETIDDDNNEDKLQDVYLEI